MLRLATDEAQVLADELSLELHPIWGDRGQIIVESLVRDGWERREGS